MRIVWPPQVPDELLSSYLARVSIAYGTTPHKLMALYAPGCQVWTRDVDVCASRSLLERLAYPSGKSLQMLYGLTLVGWNEVTRRSLDPPQGVYHWINSLGIYHRSRQRHGLTFCPGCLEEDGAYLRQWRLSFWTVCPIHQRLLQDACPQCGAVVQPHRQGFDLRMCWNCNRSLTACESASSEVSPLQSLLFRCLINPERPFYFNGHACSGSEVLWGADALLSAFKPMWRRLGIGSERGPRIEMQRLVERHADIGMLERLLSLGPIGLVAMAHSMRMTQRYFRQEMPIWVSGMVRQLPEGRTRPGMVCSRTEIRTVGEAQTRRVKGWRELRAGLLFKMIGRSNEH